MNKPVEPRGRKAIEEILSQANASSWRDRIRSFWLRWSIVAAAALLALWALWPFGGGNSAARFVTAPVQRGDLTVVVSATGSVQPTNKVDVSSELSGTVRKVLVDYNSVVSAGQALAELDTDKLKATVDASRARLNATKAKVKDAEATALEKQRDLGRKTLLSSKNIRSVQDLDVAQAAYDRAVAGVASANADVGAAEAELKLNETNLSKSCICSPISGIVLKRNVEPGQTVASTFQAPVLFTIAEDLKKMELQVDVDEADVGKVKVGQSATFSVDAFPDRKFPAQIRDLRFASETIQGVVTYKAVLSIDNSELLLRPGMTATAEIRVEQFENTVLVPNAALRFSPTASEPAEQRSFLRRLMPGPPRFRPPSARKETGATRTVWILRDGVPTALNVEIGPSDGQNSQLATGDLEEGQAVIIDQIAAKP